MLAYSLLMVRTKKLLAHLKRWCPKGRQTKQVPYLFFFYFIFFFFCWFLRTSMSPSRDRVDFIWYARAVFFFFLIRHFLSFLIFFWSFLPAGLLVFLSRLAFIQVGEQILDFFRGSEKRREKETDRHARGRRRRKKGRRAIYTQHKRRIQASSLIRHGEKERLMHYCWSAIALRLKGERTKKKNRLIQLHIKTKTKYDGREKWSTLLDSIT